MTQKRVFKDNKPMGIWSNEEIKDKAKKISKKLTGLPSASQGFNYSVNQLYEQMFGDR